MCIAGCRTDAIQSILRLPAPSRDYVRVQIVEYPLSLCIGTADPLNAVLGSEGSLCDDPGRRSAVHFPVD